ncbi:MAG: hypothetical protein KAS38_19185, partial [Anaerolineales bacterium]|nr:hypothetical protein [Anaerolineales bacterium]
HTDQHTYADFHTNTNLYADDDAYADQYAGTNQHANPYFDHYAPYPQGDENIYPFADSVTHP